MRLGALVLLLAFPVALSQETPPLATRLSEIEIDALPNRDVFGVLEDIAPGFVTDRIDVGGLRSNSPARFGGFGSSWTQNAYLVGGLNLTDPYSGDRPLLFPVWDAWGDVEIRASTDVSAGPAGTALSFEPARASPGLHGSLSLFGSGGALQGARVGEDKAKLGVDSRERFGTYGSGSLVLSGPLSASAHVRAGAARTTFTRSPQNVDALVRSDLSTAFVAADATSGTQSWELFGALQRSVEPDSGASARVPLESTLDESRTAGVLQVADTVRLESGLRLATRVGFAATSFHEDAQATAQPSAVELFTGRASGAAPLSTEGRRLRVGALSTLSGPTRLAGRPADVLLGLSWEEIESRNDRRASRDVTLRLLAGRPVQAVLYDGESRTRQRLRHLALFGRLASRVGPVNFALGLRLQSSRGFLPDEDAPAITWTSLSPSLSAALPVSRRVTLHAAISRHAHELLGSLLYFQDRNALGGRVVAWTDPNGDGRFQPGEAGATLRVFGGGRSFVDPDLAPPHTDTIRVGVSVDLSRVKLALVAMQRLESRLVETVDVGVPASSYRPVVVHDAGDDGIPGTHDDQDLTLYDQDPATLGKNRLLLTNPDGFESRYRGVTLAAWTRDLAPGLFALASFAAYRIDGKASAVDGTLDHDPGVVGVLFDDPNTLVNAEGRLFFDRSFVAKVAASYRLPGGVVLGTVAKYWDGLPFARRLVVTGFHQGPIAVFATQRGNGDPGENGVRVEYNLTVDLGIEKRFRVLGADAALRLDVFNLLDAENDTRESDLSGVDFDRRFPTESQAPRVVRLGMKVGF